MHFTKAPIIEAIIDLKVVLPDDCTVDSLESMHKHILRRFPTKEPLYGGSFQLQAGEAVDIRLTDSHHLQGYRFVSDDKVRTCQAQLSGFTFNHLTPYTSWEPFRDEAKELWQVYKEVCRPSVITRVAVRYINRLELPGPFLDFKDYLRTFP